MHHVVQGEVASGTAFILKRTDPVLFNGVLGCQLGVPDGKSKGSVLGEAPIG